MFLSFDMPVIKKDQGNKILGVGLSVYNDVAGKSEMSLSGIELSVSSKLAMGPHQYLSLGVQAGYLQESVNYDGLLWDEHYTGVGMDYSLLGEQMGGESLAYPDMGAGLYWNYRRKSFLGADAGFSIRHFSRPEQSFLFAQDPAQLKMNFHASATIGDRNALVPRMIFQKQGGAMELILGGHYEMALGSESRYTNYSRGSAVFAGLFYRMSDAVIFSLGMDYKGAWRFEMSYDTNVSKLSEASLYRGGLEVSVRYSGLFQDARIKLKR